MGKTQDRMDAWTVLAGALRAAAGIGPQGNNVLTGVQTCQTIMTAVSTNTISAQNITDINANLLAAQTAIQILSPAFDALVLAVTNSNVGLTE